jgi:hypothetical protein
MTRVARLDSMLLDLLINDEQHESLYNAQSYIFI